MTPENKTIMQANLNIVFANVCLILQRLYGRLLRIPTDNDIKISEMYAAARVLEEKIVKKAS